MKIVGDGVVLRRYRTEDRDALAAIADDPEVSRWLTDRFPHPYRTADAEAWIAAAQQEIRPCNFAIEAEGRLAGGIGVVPLEDVHSGTAEFGYWLGADFRGRGIASAAAAAFLPYVFDELFFIRAQAMVFSGNIASMRVLEKNGFLREGVMRKHIRKNGTVSDAVLYAKLHSDPR